VHINLLTLLITALAVMRVTRLIVLDQITMPIRSWVVTRNGDTGWWTFLLHCPLCASVWIAAAVAPLYWFVGRSPGFLIPVLALAFAQLVVFVNKAEIL
jgi:hypothetical protein